MLDIAFYSNDSAFLNGCARELSEELGLYSRATSFHIHRVPLLQTTLYPEDIAYDLCIVDICEEPEAGLPLAGKLAARSDVILVAPGPQWAMEAYDADVVAYYLSPPDIKRMVRMLLRRYLRDQQEQDQPFSFRTGAGLQMLSPRQISYVEYSDHRLNIHTDLDRVIATNTMRSSFSDAAAQLLENPCFLRTHASFIVNILHVSQFAQTSLLLDTGASVPVSHGRKKEVKEHFNRFFQKEEE